MAIERFVTRALVIGTACWALAACGGSGVPARIAAPANPIKHVVIIVQENRSLNNLFNGFPGAHTVPYGYDSKGDKLTLKPVVLETTWDILHFLNDYLAACNGRGRYPGTNCRMNGFDKEGWTCQTSCPDTFPPYAYVPHSETKPYFYLGEHYVLGDEMYTSNVDSSSFVSHQYIIAGQAKSSVNYPDSTLWGCPGGPYDMVGTITKARTYGNKIPLCWNSDTIGSELNATGHTWAYYASSVYGSGGIWSAYQNIAPIYKGPDWQRDVISPQTQFFDDVADGKLRDVTWITPTLANSDHAGSGSNTGPSWVASLVNAIGTSRYWNDTAIFIFWDDYGGWYDPEPPPHLDYDGLGIRVPLLVVSAYAKSGYVDHTQYEHGSILRFVEDTFGLRRLAASDRRATAPYAAFDFTKPARAFQTVPSERGIDYFKRQPPDHRNPDPG